MSIFESDNQNQKNNFKKKINKVHFPLIGPFNPKQTLQILELNSTIIAKTSKDPSCSFS